MNKLGRGVGATTRKQISRGHLSCPGKIEVRVVLRSHLFIHVRMLVNVLSGDRVIARSPSSSSNPQKMITENCMGISL